MAVQKFKISHVGIKIIKTRAINDESLIQSAQTWATTTSTTTTTTTSTTITTTITTTTTSPNILIPI